MVGISGWMDSAGSPPGLLRSRKGSRNDSRSYLQGMLSPAIYMPERER